MQRNRAAGIAGDGRPGWLCPAGVARGDATLPGREFDGEDRSPGAVGAVQESLSVTDKYLGNRAMMFHANRPFAIRLLARRRRDEKLGDPWHLFAD